MPSRRPCSASAADVAGEGDQPFIRGPYSGSKDRGPAGADGRAQAGVEARDGHYGERNSSIYLLYIKIT